MPVRVKRVLTEEKLDVAYFLQNCPSKSLRCLSQRAVFFQKECMESYKTYRYSQKPVRNDMGCLREDGWHFKHCV